VRHGVASVAHRTCDAIEPTGGEANVSLRSAIRKPQGSQRARWEGCFGETAGALGGKTARIAFTVARRGWARWSFLPGRRSTLSADRCNAARCAATRQRLVYIEPSRYSEMSGTCDRAEPSCGSSPMPALAVCWNTSRGSTEATTMPSHPYGPSHPTLDRMGREDRPS